MMTLVLLSVIAAAVPVLLRAPPAPSGVADIWQAGRAPLLGAMVRGWGGGQAQQAAWQDGGGWCIAGG